MVDKSLANGDDVHYLRLRTMAQQAPGSRLPTERELAELLDLPRTRIRTLLSQLEAEGLVYRKQGSGTYAIDLQAQPLQTVALLVDQHLKLGEDPFFSTVIEHLQDAVQEVGFRCVIARIDGHHHPWGLGDGFITVGLAGQGLLNDWKSNDPPLVNLFLVGPNRSGVRASLLQLDDIGAGREVARTLIDRGCRELLFIGNRQIPASLDRLTGIEQVATEYGIPLQIQPCHLNYTAGVIVGQMLRQANSEPTRGIIAANDWLALGVRTGLGDHGRLSETTLPIISFDGLAITSDERLHIESLAVPIQTIAWDAINELRRIATAPQMVGRTIRYQLVWRSNR